MGTRIREDVVSRNRNIFPMDIGLPHGQPTVRMNEWRTKQYVQIGY